LEWTGAKAGLMLARMGQTNQIGGCPRCGRTMKLALVPGTNVPNHPQCLGCEQFDPLESKLVTGWLNGELGRAKRSVTQSK
jgi:hypothetical protein